MFREIDDLYVARTYKRYPVEVVSGKGSVVEDVNGKKYIDMGAGIGVTAFGIADEQWKEAVCGQLDKVQHMSNLYYTEPCALLAKELCLRTGMRRVFFSNSGAEANECAIKAARKYAAEKKGGEYNTIITLENSFHGRTITTLSATGQEDFHKLFTPLTPGFVHIPANDTGALRRTLSRVKCAGIMIECVQGEGGVLPLREDFVKAVSRLAEEEDIILIVDEVQTGNGRTGKLYGYMNFDIMPDVVSTAKGLAGGLPLGATLLGDKVKDIFAPGDNGSTFGGNPVCCAAALSVLERLTEELLKEVKAKSDYIFDELSGAPGVEAVSGMGLMIGIKTAAPAADIVNKCIERGVLCLTAKDKVRLLPALNIPLDLLKEALGIIKEECARDN
ncbi:MAG: acetylornithine/succinylornithine family transaminase [Lachnospiraceae bacterium]|jgi:acetylornithine/N-succinyldiaminopimelate aminotransferase